MAKQENLDTACELINSFSIIGGVTTAIAGAYHLLENGIEYLSTPTPDTKGLLLSGIAFVTGTVIGGASYFVRRVAQRNELKEKLDQVERRTIDRATRELTRIREEQASLIIPYARNLEILIEKLGDKSPKTRYELDKLSRARRKAVERYDSDELDPDKAQYHSPPMQKRDSEI